MDRIWQWAWDRCGARYSWVICAISFPAVLPNFLFTSFLVVAFERPGHYNQAAVSTVVAALVICYYAFLTSGRRRFGLVEQWAAGQEVDRRKPSRPPIRTLERRLPEVWQETLWVGPRC
jgi:hypothetical protein